MSLAEHYQKKINCIRNNLFKLSHKLERNNIKQYALNSDLLTDLDNNLDNLDCSIIKLQYEINNFLNVKQNISLDKQEKIKQNELQNKVIKDLLPYYMMYYMNVESEKNNMDIDSID